MSTPSDQEVLEGMMAAPPKEPLDPTAQHIINGLKAVFAGLEHEIAAVDTSMFCRALGLTNRQMCIQEDANELLKKILDRIEVLSGEQDAKTEESPQLASSLQTLQLVSQRLDSTKYKEHYKALFEGVHSSKVLCTRCGHVSHSEQAFTDFMLSVEKDYFECLAKILSPEEIDGYHCSGCGKSVLALKFISYESVPQVAVMTLSRFQQDFETMELKKVNEPVHCPLAIDLSRLMKTDYQTFCAGDDYTFNDKKYQRLVEYLKVISMPWNYFNKDDESLTMKRDIESSMVMEQLKVDKEFLHYVKKHYVHGVSTAFFDQSAVDDYYTIPMLESIPENLYILSAVVCHMGSLNMGHYYTLVNKTIHNPATKFITCTMFQANDESFYQLDKPVEMLQYIAGKVQKIQHNSDMDEKTKKMFDFGNTGYMYFYEPLRNALTLSTWKVKLTDSMLKSISRINTEQLEKLSQFEAAVTSNYTLGPVRTCFGEFDERMYPKYAHKIKFDYRKTARELLGLYVAQLVAAGHPVPEIDDVKVFKLLWRKKTADAELNRDKELPLDQPIEADYKNFKYYYKVFIQFKTDAVYDEDAEYVRFCRLQAKGEELVTVENIVVNVDVAAEELTQKIYVQCSAMQSIALLKTALATKLVGADAAKVCAQVQRIVLMQEALNGYELLSERPDTLPFPFSSGEMIYFDTTQLPLSKAVCQVVNQENTKGENNTVEVSTVFRHVAELKNGYLVDIVDENCLLQVQKRYRKTQLFGEILKLVDQMAGDSDCGHQARSVLQVAGSKTQVKLLLVLNGKQDFTTQTIEQVYKKSNQYAGRFDTVYQNYLQIQIMYNELQAKNAFTFIINSENSSYGIFSMARNMTVFNEGDTVGVLWHRYSMQGATVQQLTTCKALSKPVEQLRFFYLKADTAVKKQQEGRLWSMMSTVLQPTQKLSVQLFKEPFYIYVEERSQYEELAKSMTGVEKPITFTTVQLMWNDGAELVRVGIDKTTTVQQLEDFAQAAMGQPVQLYADLGKDLEMHESNEKVASIPVEMWCAQ